MASEAQIAANRRNARKSTGPKTDAGRAVASRNALRHGLTAEQLVLFDERAEDLARFREELRAALDPADAVEEALAERIVLCAWRLRRAVRVEAALINAAAANVNNVFYQPGLGGAFRNATASLALAQRYEAALDRALSRAQTMLERRQARRRSEPVIAPIAVDLDARDAGDPIAAHRENYETKPIPAPEPPAEPPAPLDAPAWARQKRRAAAPPSSLPAVAAEVQQAAGRSREAADMTRWRCDKRAAASGASGLG